MALTEKETLNSPIQQLKHPLLAERNVRLWVKRDDLIHPIISGNKWRKLKYLLEDARQQGCHEVVTFGGAWSNHLLATAAACAVSGFRSTGYVRGELPENPNLSLCSLFGMNLLETSRSDYKDKTALYNRLHGKDREAYFIDEGGRSEQAVAGCAEMIGELERGFDHIFCAAGTGTTLAGLARGLQQANLNTRLHGVPVLAGGFMSEELKGLGADPRKVILHEDYHFGGYAKAPTALLSFIAEFVRDTGMLIEPVYTGKLFYAIFDLIKRGYFPEKEEILAIHTGGLFGILGKLENLRPYLNTRS